jgi:uncharacterized protein YjbJ (UPF0337 family)
VPKNGGDNDKEDAMTVDKDRVEGSATNLGGMVKKGAVKLTGDAKLKTEGIVDQMNNKVQVVVGSVKSVLGST